MSNEKKFYLVLLLVLIIAAGLRLYKFDCLLSSDDAFHQSIYDDERKILDTALSIDFSSGVYGPPTLDYTALGFYIYRTALEVSQAVGIIAPLDSIKQKSISPDELKTIYLVGRFIFFLVGIALIIIVAIVTKMIFGPGQGLIAAAFTAVLPASVLIGRVIRFHGLVCVFLVLLFYYSYKIMQSNSIRSHILAGVMLGFAMSSMYVALPAAIFPLMALILYIKPDSPAELLKTIFNGKLWKGYVAGVIIFSICSFFVIFNILHIGTSWLKDISRATNEKFFVDPITEGVGYYFYGLLQYAFGPFFLILVGFGIYHLIKKRSGKLILLSSGTLAIILLQLVFISKRLLVRHTSWYMPFLCIFAAVAAVEMYRFGGKFRKAFAVFLVLAVICTNLFISIQLVRWQSQTWPQITASRWLVRQITPKEPVAAMDNFKELYPFILSVDNSLGDFRRKRDLIEIQNNFAKLQSSNANYFVVPKWELYGLRDKYIRRPEKYPIQFDFLTKIEQNGLYELEKSFSNEPPWPQWFFGSRLVPRDLKLFGMEILIYKRTHPAGN